MQEQSPIRVLIFQDHGWWVAQCLEYDIGAQAETLKDLMHRLDTTIEVEKRVTTERNGAAFKGIEPAPQEFFERWEHADGQFLPSKDGEIAGLTVQYAMAA